MARDAVAMSGSNISDQLNAAGISWGWSRVGSGPWSRTTDHGVSQ